MFESRDGGQHCDHESGHDVALGSQTVAILESTDLKLEKDENGSWHIMNHMNH